MLQLIQLHLQLPLHLVVLTGPGYLYHLVHLSILPPLVDRLVQLDQLLLDLHWNLWLQLVQLHLDYQEILEHPEILLHLEVLKVQYLQFLL